MLYSFWVWYSGLNSMKPGLSIINIFILFLTIGDIGFWIILIELVLSILQTSYLFVKSLIHLFLLPVLVGFIMSVARLLLLYLPLPVNPIDLFFKLLLLLNQFPLVIKCLRTSSSSHFLIFDLLLFPLNLQLDPGLFSGFSLVVSLPYLL